jgi:HipA-like protein
MAEVKKARVFYNKVFCGTIERLNDSYRFDYDESYRQDSRTEDVSLMLPKSQKSFLSKTFFQCFEALCCDGAGFPRFVPLDFLNTVPLLNA